MKYIKNFLLMIQLLTRIPVNMGLPCEEDDFRRGSGFFWLVGLVIGAIQLGVYFLGQRFFNMDIGIIFIILVDVLITGGFHIDGFGDTCDGFFAFKGKDKIIDIMKDSRIGTFAGIGIVMDLLIKYIGYKGALISTGNVLLILLLPVISRVAIVFICYIGKPAKEKGSGNLFINTVRLPQVFINFIFLVIISLLVTSYIITVALVLVAIVVVLLFNKFCNSKINGITGDSLGATNELVVLITLIALCAKF